MYNQLTADRGPAPSLIISPVKSRIFGVGPQLGYLFPIANMRGYLNLRGYVEFDSYDRASGWNTWLTFSIAPPPPPAPTPPTSQAPMIYKKGVM
jgi:hypothetical protein